MELKIALFSPQGSDIHIHCIIRTSICSITVKQLPHDYLLQGFYSSYILVWDITVEIQAQQV